MILKRIIFCCFIVLLGSSIATAGPKIAGEEDIVLLKKDILEGRIKVGETRLKKIKEVYGDPLIMTESSKKLVYDYGDLKIEFEKEKYLRDWEYDYSHKTAYSDDIDTLRSDLESEEIVGDYIALSEIKKDYDEPTEVFATSDDGDESIYYYGEIKMMFENVILISKIKGKNLLSQEPEEESEE